MFRDSYLMALINADALVQSVDATAREARTAQDAVIAARNRYWAHVVRHGCRKSYREIDSRLQLISPGNTRKVAG